VPHPARHLIRRLLCLILLGIGLLTLSSACSADARKERALDRANRLFDQQQFQHAEIEYMNVLKLDPANPVALRNLGLIAYAQGRVMRALAILNEARKLQPNDAEVQLRLAQCLQAIGAAPPARQHAVEILDAQPANAEALRLLVDASQTPEDLADAVKRLDGLRATMGDTADFHLAWGLAQLRLGDLDAAEKAFRTALARDAQSSAAHIGLGNAFRQRNQLDNAASEYKIAAQLAPKYSPHPLHYVDFMIGQTNLEAAAAALAPLIKATPDYLPVQIRSARVSLLAGRYQECEQTLKKVLASDPAHVDALLMQAQLALAKGDQTGAIAALEDLVKQYPMVARFHYELALAQFRNGAPTDTVLRRLDEALKLKSDYTEAVLLRAGLSIQANNPARARTLLEDLIEREPGNKNAQILLATAQHALGNTDAAIEMLDRTAEANPDDPQIPFRAGLLLREGGRHSEAEKKFMAALAVDPAFLPATEQLVELDLIANRLDSAVNRAETAAAANPQVAAAQILLGRVQFALKNYAAAEEAVAKAIQLAPDTREPQLLMARIHAAAKRPSAALAILDQWVARHTNDVPALLEIAQIHMNSTNYPAARDTCEKILQLDPGFVSVLNNLAWMYAEHLGDLKRAHELASKARSRAPENPAVADTLGWILYRNGDYAGALALLRQSASQLSEHPEVLFHLGMAAYMTGDETLAKSALTKALNSSAAGEWEREARSKLRILEIDPASATTEALAALEPALQDAPEDPILLDRIATLAERQQAWNKSLDLSQRALLINSNLQSALVRIARLNAGPLNNHQRAMEFAQRARKANPDDPYATHILGKLAYTSAASASDFQWAHSLLSEASRRLTANPDVLFDYAKAAYAVGRTSDAVDAMQRVAQSQSANATAARTFIELDSLLKNPAGAGNAGDLVQQTLKSDPAHLPGLMLSGHLQVQNGNLSDAQNTYEHVLKRYPAFWPVLKQLALLNFGNTNNAAKAYEYARLAREAAPQDPDLARVLGWLEFDRGEYARAAQLLTEARNANPNDTETLYRLGIAQYRLRRIDQGKETLSRALELAPESALAAEARRLLDQE